MNNKVTPISNKSKLRYVTAWLHPDIRNLVIGIAASTMFFIAGIVVNWTASFFSFTRQYITPMEQYTGKYVQIIYPQFEAEVGSNGKVVDSSINEKHKEYYYSILDIHYDRSTGVFALTGHQYDNTGMQTTSFSSDVVNEISANFTYLKFIWKTNDISDPHPEVEERKVDGYTEMMFADSSSDLPVGTGFFVGFHVRSTKTKFSFFRITKKMIETMRISTPSDVDPITGSEENKNGNKLVNIPVNDYENTIFIRGLEQARQDHRNVYFFRNLINLPIL